MAKSSETALRIAGRLAGLYATCIANGEPIGAATVMDCAEALDKDFRGVFYEFAKCIEKTRQESPEVTRKADVFFSIR